MVTRLKITISDNEYSALLKIADVELRYPEEELRYLMRAELIRRGLLSDSDDTKTNQNIPQSPNDNGD